MVMGVKDAASQLDQLPVIAEQEQIVHADFRGSHQHWTHPIADLQAGRKTAALRQIKAVFPDHQHQRAVKAGLRRQARNALNTCCS